MSDTRELLRPAVEGFEPMPDAFERVLARRDRKQRNQRVAAGVLGLAVFALAVIGLVRLLGSEHTPATPGDGFAGTWVSTSDGSTQTMIVRVSSDDAVEVVVTDDFTGACAGTASTMTGTGRIEDGTAAVIPAPVFTCDAGSQIENVQDPPVEEVFRDWTLVLDPETDTLSDDVVGRWVREGAVAPSPGPRPSGQMWPQTSYQEVVEAQQLADAGDPRATWQVDPDLASSENLYPWDSEIVERFLRQGLGWEEWAIPSGTFAGGPGGPYNEVSLIRCAPGRTNPLYPGNRGDAGGCAPTIDDLGYETVRIDLDQPGLRGPSGIWVITGWEMLQPVEPSTFYEHVYPQEAGLRQIVQVAPPSDAEVDALLQSFLQARVEGEGAEEYVHRHPDGWDDREVPVMYATTAGSPYQRYRLDRVQGPVWPTGWIELRVHLFAEDGTEVEQTFVAVRQEDGRLGLMYGLPFDSNVLPTTEDGRPVPVPYSFLDGAVTLAAAPPWNEGGSDAAGSLFLNLDRNWMRIAVDPLPVAQGCLPGPAPADAEALARSIRSDPDLEATIPAAVSVGGIDALRIDVALAPGASCFQGDELPMVVEKSRLGDGNRMRVYLLDLPGSDRTLTITIAASGPDFEHVLEAAAPVLDSFEFHGS